MAPNESPAFSLRAQSQRYARYEARIQAIRKVLDGVYRHRIPLTVTVIVAAVLVLCFLGIIGQFTGEARCADFTYGDLPVCSLKAFLSGVEYQYAPATGEAVWSGEVPVVPGRYRIRAVSKNGFGLPRYSEEMTAVLLPRDLTVGIAESAYLYGDFSEELVKKNTTAQGIAQGDSLAAVEYAVEGTEAGGYHASVSKVRIVNGAGRDVTSGYAVTTEDGVFTMMPRPITVSAGSFRKEYDGLPWDAAKAEVTEGTLAFHDSLHASFEPCPAEAGTHALVPKCRILDEHGSDVSACYAITERSGTLTVTPRLITVQTGSGEKTYDEKPLVNPQWSVVSGEIAPGHSLSGEPTGRQTHAGESRNTINLIVRDGSGRDVSANYQFTVQAGILKVDPIVLKFQTDSSEKVYDGKPLRENGCRLLEGNVLSGHTLQFRTDAVAVDAGDYRNVLNVTVRNKAGEEVTNDGYRVEVDYGTLTIRKCPITITSESAQKLYDGMPLSCPMCAVTEGGVQDSSIGEHIGAANFSGSQTEVGSSPNTFTVELCNGANEDTTRNYDITYVFGTLTVLENPDYIPPDPPDVGGPPGVPELPLDGTQIHYPDVTQREEVFAYVYGYDLPVGDTLYLRAASYGEYTGRGWDAPKPYLEYDDTAQRLVGQTLAAYGGQKSSVIINRMDGCPLIVPYFTAEPGYYGDGNDCYYWDGSADYEVTFFPASYQDLWMIKAAGINAESEFEWGYRKFVYDLYLQIPPSTREALLAWAEEKGLSPSSPTLVEDIQTAIMTAARYDLAGKEYPEDVDVAVYFLTQAQEGICQHFATAATMLYRAFGIPARYTTGFMTQINPEQAMKLTGKNAHAWVEIYQDGLGWVPIEVTGAGGSTGPGFPPETGKIELCLQAYSATKYYDGKGFQSYDVEQYAISSGSLKEGHRLEVSVWSQKDACAPGIYSNLITHCKVYDEQGRDVTDEYSIHTIEGRLEILPRKITIALGSASKRYDGKPLTCGEYWIAKGSLAPGDRLVLTMGASLTEPGRVENTASECEILRGDLPHSYTFCYQIEFIPGYLEIIPAKEMDIP